MAELEKKGFTLYLDPELKENIEDDFLKHKIKNFNEGYREIISIGYEQWKKLKKGGRIGG